MSNKICLAMIVKNESKIIERCLRSVIDHIDYWVICDTGSTDDTRAVIQGVLEDIPGKLYNVPWVDFGHNRSQALVAARPHGDYTLMLDADYELRIAPGGFDWNALTKDAYALRHEGEIDFTQTWIFSNKRNWRFVGAVHEYAVCDGSEGAYLLDGITIINHGDGSNERDDLAVLLPEYEKNPSNPRTIFYIAQTHLGLRNHATALHWYNLRAEMDGGDPEERWYAAMMVARLRQQFEADPKVVRASYMEAYFLRPHRFEPLCWLAQYCRLSGDYHSAFTFSSLAGTDLRYPHGDGLLIDRKVYEYLMLFEFGIASAATRRVRFAVMAYERLENTSIPTENLKALSDAIEWAQEQTNGN
jgi:glycosyltransferase involved in cell wall biosynthesis